MRKRRSRHIFTTADDPDAVPIVDCDHGSESDEDAGEGDDESDEDNDESDDNNDETNPFSPLNLTSFGVGLSKAIEDLCKEDKDLIFFGVECYGKKPPLYFYICACCCSIMRVEFGMGRSTFSNIKKHTESGKHRNNASNLRKKVLRSLKVKSLGSSFRNAFSDLSKEAVPPRTAYALPERVTVPHGELRPVGSHCEWQLPEGDAIPIIYTASANTFFSSRGASSRSHVRQPEQSLVEDFFGRISEAD